MGRSGQSLGRSRHLYTPPHGSVPGDADRATFCPMGSRCPGLNAVFRMPSAVAKENYCAYQFSEYYIYLINTCFLNRLLYIMHKFNCYICAYLPNTAMSADFRSACSCSAYISTILCTFHAVITPAFPSLEAPEHPCTCLRSAALSAVVCPVAVLLELVPSLPCRKQLLLRKLSLHLFRVGYAIY